MPYKQRERILSTLFIRLLHNVFLKIKVLYIFSQASRQQKPEVVTDFCIWLIIANQNITIVILELRNYW